MSVSDSLALSLTPGAGSNFTVQSPLTRAEYSMPRSASIFAHTRSYLERLGAVALGRTAATSPTPVPSPSHKAYTAPDVRGIDPAQATPAQHAFSAIGPHTLDELTRAAVESYHVNSVRSPSIVDEAAAHWSASALDPLANDAHDLPPTPAPTYVPPQFLNQPLAQPLADATQPLM
jgi:hypothetical protein